MIGELSKEMRRLCKNFLGNYLRIPVIKQTKNLEAIDYANEENHLPEDEVAIGVATIGLMEEEEDPHPKSSFLGWVILLSFFFSPF